MQGSKSKIINMSDTLGTNASGLASLTLPNEINHRSRGQSNERGLQDTINLSSHRSRFQKSYNQSGLTNKQGADSTAQLHTRQSHGSVLSREKEALSIKNKVLDVHMNKMKSSNDESPEGFGINERSHESTVDEDKTKRTELRPNNSRGH